MSHWCSHGRCCHLDAPYYISLVIIHTSYSQPTRLGWCVAACGRAPPLAAFDARPSRQVHSVSYGWQGNLSQIHVLDADVETIDSNLAKMATLGTSRRGQWNHSDGCRSLSLRGRCGDGRGGFARVTPPPHGQACRS
jgi:hypothetical protein